MRFSVTIDGDLNDLMTREYRAGERAVTSSIRAAAAALKADWRAQITGAGLGGKLAKAVQSKVYPSEPSLNAAGLVYSKAPKITGAFETGPVIRAASGFWLAIPLPAAGKGLRGGRITPAEWEKRTGRVLRFVYRGGKRALLVDDGRKAAGNVMVTRRRRGQQILGAPTTFRNRTVPIFALVPQVQLRKRLNLYASAEQFAAGLPSAIVRNWRGE